MYDDFCSIECNAAKNLELGMFKTWNKTFLDALSFSGLNLLGGGESHGGLNKFLFSAVFSLW